MKINENGIVRDMTAEEEAQYIAETEAMQNSAEVKQMEIDSLKSELSSLDYKTIKWMEGYYTDEEYAPTKARKQELRNRINELEKSLIGGDQ